MKTYNKSNLPFRFVLKKKKKNQRKNGNPSEVLLMGGGSFFIRERVGTHQRRCIWAEEITFWEEVGHNPKIKENGEGPSKSNCYLCLSVSRFCVSFFFFWCGGSTFFCRIESVWELLSKKKKKKESVWELFVLFIVKT